MSDDTVILDDSELEVPAYSSVCTFCRHVSIERKRICAAFPVGIPLEIWLGENKHTKPYTGDNGIRFEPAENVKPEVLARYGLPAPENRDRYFGCLQ